jgi:hypothetical protein
MRDFFIFRASCERSAVSPRNQKYAARMSITEMTARNAIAVRKE